LRLIKPVAGSDKIVRRSQIVGGVRSHTVAAIAAGRQFHRSHETQLKAVSTMSLQHADTGKIARVPNAGRRDHARESNRISIVKGELPIAILEIRDRSAVEKRREMKIRKRIRHVIVMIVDFTNPVHHYILKKAAYCRHHMEPGIETSARSIDCETIRADRSSR
jgi:hypothetical protein